MKRIGFIFLLPLLTTIQVLAQPDKKENVTTGLTQKNQRFMTITPKMKIAVWSDMMCPFCYIGKRHFEAALREFADSMHVTLEWHSFQLDPDIPRNPVQGQTTAQYLSERKGISAEQVAQMNANVTAMAAAAGLTYHLDKTVLANSFDAHRLLQLAKTKGLGDAAEEQMFHAHFTEGKNLGDHPTLLQLGIAIGIEEQAVQQVLKSNAFADAVEQDIQDAARIGVRGVPFFVFNDKYAISGAQAPAAFLETLRKSFAEWRKDNPETVLEVSEGSACTPAGKCN